MSFPAENNISSSSSSKNENTKAINILLQTWSDRKSNDPVKFFFDQIKIQSSIYLSLNWNEK